MGTNGKTNTTSLELQICTLQDKVLAMMNEEENLRHLKSETAKDFRLRIADVKATRVKEMRLLEELKQKSLEEEGTVILDKASRSSNSRVLEASEALYDETVASLNV